MKLQEKDVKLTPPHVNEPDLSKALTKIYKDLNDLKESVHNFKGKEAEDTAEGSEGDIRVVKTSRTGNYTLQIRGDEGWLEDKTAKYVSLKGDVDIAQEQEKPTLLKSVGGLMPSPDYESDWTDITNGQNYDFTHNLGTKIFRHFHIILKDDSDRVFYPGIATSEHGTTDAGIYAYAKSDSVMEISTGNTYLYEYDNTTLGGTIQKFADGWIKLMIWK
tara:strand:+ start:7158 stop:7811 length:654 start_codon:yes stop_codon:yes gene_type:complete